MTEHQDKIGGLELKEPDRRDFSYVGVFGAPDLSYLPAGDWLTGNIWPKDQGNTDMCTGFGLAGVREDTEDEPLSPEWLFAQIKKLRGDPLAWGGDLNSGCKVAVKGALARAQSPNDFRVEKRDRDFLAQAKNWPDLEAAAAPHRAESFLRVDGPHDTFDNARAFLWENRNYKRSIYTGCMWRPGWSRAPGGVIPRSAIAGGVGHCFKIANGQKIINGKPHLIIQNSSGPEAGDGGLFYMSREVANRELKFGMYAFIDMAPEEVKDILRPKGLLVEKDTRWERFLNWILRITY